MTIGCQLTELCSLAEGNSLTNGHKFTEGLNGLEWICWLNIIHWLKDKNQPKDVHELKGFHRLKYVQLPLLVPPMRKVDKTNSQLEFTFGGQNHEFSKYVVFNTFNCKKAWEGHIMSCRYGILQKHWVSTTRFQDFRMSEFH